MKQRLFPLWDSNGSQGKQNVDMQEMSPAQEEITEDRVRKFSVRERVERPQHREVRPAYMKADKW